MIVQQNYFFYLYAVKILDRSTKPFFPRSVKKKQNGQLTVVIS